MKKLLLLLVSFFVAATLFAQERINPTDSLLVDIEHNISSIGMMLIDHGVSNAGRYKIYSTTNIYTSLKLDTATGKITALQVTLNQDSTFEYSITDAVASNETMIGRFELYPTQNIHNFILLDTALGTAYQVQWSTKKEECGRWRIY